MNDFISFIIIKEDNDKKPSNFPFSLNQSHHIYLTSKDDWEKHGKRLMQIDLKEKGKWESCDHTAISTPWVLFLEEQEYLSSADYKKLINYVKKKESAVTALNIERLTPHGKLESYKWVTTRNIFENPSDVMRRYFTTEVRLIPAIRLKDITLNPTSKSLAENQFILKLSQGNMDITQSNLSISRHSNNIFKEPKLPLDSQVFKHGHQKYFDDKEFSPRFQWPHTVYHTIRLDHVPSIMSALKKGLSNPEIVLFTLVYLIRFREFAKASELVSLIPEHWCRRDPALLNIVATLYFINGQHEKAINLYEIGVDLFPDSEWMIQNAIKIHILMDRYQDIDKIALKYKETTGEELKDDYLYEFMEIHKGLPKQTATLSLCMVVKDEEKTLERAILSAQPMADEVIVVDTGSTDRSPAIAERLGAKVYSYDWNDDFSAARNFAINKATCDYIMMLDGDEYISPFFHLDCMTLKRLFPVDKPYALSIPTGSYFNETDWLFIVTETGNFRTETMSTRIFPRQKGIEYQGRIGESIDQSLAKINIPVRIMPEKMLHIIHDTKERMGRIERKCHIYKKLSRPEYPLILSAIRDFSFLGKMDETLEWLSNFYRKYSKNDEIKLKVGLKLAKLLETNNPFKAEHFYKELFTIYPDELPVLLSYADYLLKNNKLDSIQNLSFDLGHVETKQTQKDKIELKCFKSIKYFELKEYEKAFDALTEVLDESPVNIFAQALRFYYLMYMNELEGAVASLDTLFNIFDCRAYLKIDKIEDMLGVVEKICEQLLKQSYLKERSLILEGMSNLAQKWRQSEQGVV